MKRPHFANRPPPSPTKNPSPQGSSISSITPFTSPSDRCPAPTILSTSRRAHNPTTNDVGAIRESPEHENTDTYSLQSSIQDYIIEITNDGDTLVDVLMDIAYADPDDPKVKPFHRRYADRILMDRAFGTDPTAVRSAADGLVLTGDYPEHKISIQKDDEDEPFDEEVWKEIIAELKQLEEDNNLPPDRPVPKIDYSYYLPPDDFDLTPYLDEEDAKFRAGIALRAERRKKWPEIEERRRKKLAQIYPSHSDDGPSET